MTLRFGFAPWGESIDELVDAARAAEAAGADTIWVPELHRSATIVAAAIAAGTSRVRIGTGVALAFPRSPVITALEALDLAEISDGRFTLGLGAGTRKVNQDWHHRDFDRPATRLESTITAIRAFWANSTTTDELRLDDEFQPLHITGFQRPYATRLPIPITVAAVGPAMTRLAGRVGDGWLAHELCSPGYVRERILPQLEAGWRTRGRPAHFDITASLCCSIDGDPTIARKRASHHVGFYATVRTYGDFFAFHGLADEHRRHVDAFRATRIAQPADDTMTNALTAAGAPDDVEQRIRAYEGIADSVKLSPPVSGLPPAEIRSAQRALIDLIGRLTA